ncbi:MAG: galactokinase [Chloroflexota bacterium]
MNPKERVITEFKRKYNQDPKWVVRSPGRVNLIGGHTDYNDGFVLPMAINYATWIALRPRSDKKVVVRSLDLDGRIEFDLDDFENTDSGWGEYVKGIAWALLEDGLQLSGWEGVLSGNVPIGSGLSSSAALELSVAKAFSLTSGFSWDVLKISKIAQLAENDWVGMKCGIMDQLISAAGEKDHALLIDCRTLESSPVPLPAGTAVVVLDTNTHRGLVDSAYNERREQCESAAEFFGVSKLRDVNLDEFHKRETEMDPLSRKRARHIITENDRVQKSAEAMKNGDAQLLGNLISAAHKSISEDYEVSSKELDLIVEIALEQPGCFGSRMTGAGFGGCAVALVDEDQLDSFVTNIMGQYKNKAGLEAKVYVSRACEGTSVIEM